MRPGPYLCNAALGASARFCRISDGLGNAQPAWWHGAVVAGVLSACADRAVSQAKPVMMLARWNSPPRLTSLGDWPKPAPARVIVVSMVTAVPLPRPAIRASAGPGRGVAGRCRAPAVRTGCLRLRHRGNRVRRLAVSPSRRWASCGSCRPRWSRPPAGAGHAGRDGLRLRHDGAAGGHLHHPARGEAASAAVVGR